MGITCYEERKCKTNRIKTKIEKRNNNKEHSRSINNKKSIIDGGSFNSFQKTIIKKEKKEKKVNKEKNHYFDKINSNRTNDYEDYKYKALNIHNQLREKHQSNELILNDELNKMAQKYADNCDETNSARLCPDLYDNNIIGQNIAVIKENLFDVSKICKSWYEEKNNYDFNLNRHQKNTGHFTQLVWKETKLIGFGYKKSGNGLIYFVAYYYPAGNIFNKYKENVKKEINNV